MPIHLQRIGVLFILVLVIYLTVSFHVLDNIIAGNTRGPCWESIIQLTGWSQCGPATYTHAHRLAVLIPFRDRFTELQQFLPHLHLFLNRQGVQHSFYVVNQVDSFKFNRGALLNVGALESQKAETVGVTLRVADPKQSTDEHSSHPCCLRPPPTDYLALHDVDLLPMDRSIAYSWSTVRNGIHHLIPAKLHPVYRNYPPYFGGAMLVQRQHYHLLDGFSNALWAWGLEDDDFRMRVQRSALPVTSTTNAKLGVLAFRLIHNEVLHPRDMSNYHNRLRSVRSSATKNVRNGLSTVNYTVVNRQWLMVDGVSALIFNVQLHCDTGREMCRYARDLSSPTITG